jgi:hypothetical protein
MKTSPISGIQIIKFPAITHIKISYFRVRSGDPIILIESSVEEGH